MKPINTFNGKIAALPVPDIDTDRIVPARFLKVTSKDGLGEALFADWKVRADGTPDAEFPLNRPETQGATVLIAGDNFGCGSSREHAPWALQAGGFTAVLATSFANIFYSNALKNGLLPIIIDHETYEQLVSLAEEDPETQLTIDLAAQTVTLPDGRAVHFPIDGFSKVCLLNGVDQLGYLVQQDDAISAYEQRTPAPVSTLT
ncbi:3-isopropylmalate dehydratase small subunit [Candidatus Gracilibacteria bacterium]|nr:3-isopropylmalate dehydratase small subunit [Candidatus Gracilibacteria bacterium]